MNFTGRHLQNISAFLREVYQLQDTASLRATICRSLGNLVDGHNIFIGAHDMKRTLITGCVVTRPFTTPEFIEIVNSSLGEHPLWEPIREGGAEVRCISRFATAQQWENTMLYREALGLEGVKDHLSIEFGQRRHFLASVGIFRDRRGFSDRELAIMALLMPHLGQAMENARIAETAGLVGDMAGDVLVRTDRHGRLLHVPSEVSAAFTANAGKPLTDVCRWMAASAGTLRRGALEVTLPPLRVRHGGHTFDMRMFHSHDADGGFRIFIRVSSTRQPILSPREWDTLHWIREGKSNEEIAIILGLKITTVKTHVQNLFRKLGVESRLAAARLPLDPGRAPKPRNRAVDLTAPPSGKTGNLPPVDRPDSGSASD
jgi:DNA-binding CsgD family transcriptional regulator